MQAQNIEEVIIRLEAIIAKTMEDGNPMGYFAALYHQVTVTVKDGISNGSYLDGVRMEKLDVIFANRYLDAYAQFAAKQPCTGSWKYTFDSCGEFWPTVFQNLLLGMNAHINLDLGIAAVQTNPGKSLYELQEDFNAINTVLSTMVADIEQRLAVIWPRLKWLLARVGKADSFMVDFSMQQARNGAWKFATELALLDQQQQELAIRARDEKIMATARLVSKPGFLISCIFMIVRLGEIGSVSKKIETLWKKRTV